MTTSRNKRRLAKLQAEIPLLVTSWQLQSSEDVRERILARLAGIAERLQLGGDTPTPVKLEDVLRATHERLRVLGYRRPAGA